MSPTLVTSHLTKNQKKTKRGSSRAKLLKAIEICGLVKLKREKGTDETWSGFQIHQHRVPSNPVKGRASKGRLITILEVITNKNRRLQEQKATHKSQQ